MSGITYKDAGVDIDAGNALVERIKAPVSATNRPGVVSAIGGFGGLFDLKAAGYTDPILVAATDGVGTKLKIAIDTGQLETVGIDLVAMCVNDLICQGAEPLFFLDYFATGALDVDAAAKVITGIASGCEASGCALIGGETAEMPGMYAGGDFDLAGFAVGALERGNALPSNISVGDVLLGLSSDGIHSNGYSLVRKIIEKNDLTWADPAPFAPQTLGDAFLTPTRLYVSTVLPGIKDGRIKGLAHITGGGLSENIPRILPKGTGAEISLNAWDLPPIFRWLQESGQIAEVDMLKTFNCGIGMVVIASTKDADELANDLNAIQLGTVVPGDGLTTTGKL